MRKPNSMNVKRHQDALERDAQFVPFFERHRNKSLRWIAMELGWGRGQANSFVERHPDLRDHPGRGAHGDKNPLWNGGRIIDPDGYVLIRVPDHPFATRTGYVREHRLVMEKRLGRYLTQSEVVHHLNGVSVDNQDDNLELYENNGLHMRHEWTGRKHSPETLMKMRASALASWEHLGTEERRKRVAHRRRDLVDAPNPAECEDDDLV